MTGNGQRQTVAVVGLGSIGGIAAACLAEAGRHDVIGCARKPIDTLTLERPGRTVTPPLPVITDPAEATPADWVLGIEARVRALVALGHSFARAAPTRDSPQGGLVRI